MQFHIALLTLATGSFANQAEPTTQQFVKKFQHYVELAYQELKIKSLHAQDIFLFVIPEFQAKIGKSLFQSYADKKTLLDEYAAISKKYPNMMLVAPTNSLTSKLKNDAEGQALLHKEKMHKVNAVYVFLNGQKILKHYKKNLGPADIPELEKQLCDHERRTYLAKQSKDPIPGVCQANGVTLGVDICLDFVAGNLKQILNTHYQTQHFSAERNGVDLHVAVSSSMDNALWRGSNHLPQGFAGKNHCFFVQADGHHDISLRDKRSGVWEVDRDTNNISKLKPDAKNIFNDFELAIYHINVTNPRNQLNEDVINHPALRM